MAPHSPPRTSTVATLLLLPAILLAACGGGANGSGSDQEEPGAVLSTTDITTVRRGNVSTGVMLTGSLQPKERVTLTAQVNGTVGPINADRGTRVARGHLLTTILAAGVRGQAAGAEASVGAARANAEVARRQADASRALFEQGAISELEYQRAAAAYEAANAQVEVAVAQSAGASEQAGRTRITAPFTGVVSSRSVEAGEAVSPGDPLFQVVNSSTLELSGSIPVDLAQQVRVGQEVTFRLDAYPGRTFEGRVDRVDPVADAQTRQVGLYVTLPNRNGEIIAGQFARGQVVGDQVTDVLVIPAGALRGSSSEPAVLVVENSRIARRAVTLGVRDDVEGVVVVTSGLNEGDQVLATPGAAITEGTLVRVDRPRTGVEQDTTGRQTTPVQADSTLPPSPQGEGAG